MMQIKNLKSVNDIIYINDEIAHGVYVDSCGDMYWYKEGKLHRDNDQPAIVYKCDTRCWCKDGVFHRDNDKPAVIHSNGDKRWYKYGTRQFSNKE
jgi:hypothetical protein